ncbi:MAG TPA: DUF4936 family protein [Noviherbaspirillum sp.]|uniref:DUF4936 family protein n=1 Tax=Noviherbaspirillum sp. TaxID=1926288 RepID=UPI002F942758
MDLYIYYRVLPGNAAVLQEKAAAMQQRLSRAHGIVAGLKRRPEEKEGRQTWMEVYHDVPAGFADLLQAAVTEAGLDRLADGPRHTEIFVDVIPCA